MDDKQRRMVLIQLQAAEIEEASGRCNEALANGGDADEAFARYQKEADAIKEKYEKLGLQQK